MIRFVCLLLVSTCLAQKQAAETPSVFQIEDLLPLKFSYSNKQVKKDTDKKNGIKTDLIYNYQYGWDTIPVTLRARGNFRRSNCYFSPIKIYLEKKNSAKYIFKGHKQLKVVLPCLLKSRSNDDIVKEFLAYKLYEILSDIHFKTRLAAMEYVDTRGEKSELHPLALFIDQDNLQDLYDYENEEAFANKRFKNHSLKAILIEDEKNVAKRHNAKVMKRFVHPLAQDAIASTRNAFFQFMIGNTDFSTAYRHNQKLLFLNSKAVPLPYDFDMSGLVNASYSVVSNINNQDLPITDVTQRLYRGFRRDAEITQQVRAEFLKYKIELLKIVEELKPLFDNPKSFQNSKNYILDFFKILEDDSKFKSEILDNARTK